MLNLCLLREMNDFKVYFYKIPIKESLKQYLAKYI